MKKRLSALLLALVLLTMTAQAAENSMDNFIRGDDRTYTGQFSDLQTDSPFYNNVAALYEYGLSVGKTDGTFGLQDELTVSQIIIFAGRIRSIYRTGDPEMGPAACTIVPGQPVCMPYLTYLKEEGVLGTELDNVLFTSATRAQVAHVLASLLPEAELPAINDNLVTEFYATRRYLSDVTEYTPYQQDILWLYRRGISQGSDQWGTYYPGAPITRGAVAAMLTRLVDPTLRITLDWAPASLHSVQGTTYGDLVPAGRRYTAPVSENEMRQAVEYMLGSESSTLSLQYSSMTERRASELMAWALGTVKTYCEQGYNNVSCKYTTAGTVQLTFSAVGTGTANSSYRQQALNAAIAVHDRLWAEGRITPDMTELEKANVYYTWICENTVYDGSADETSLSHLPWRLFKEGLAVCDGYTGAYNLLLKLEGISCSALYTADHIWTSAVLDGQEVHIDTTWGDEGPQISYTYFAMSPTLSALLHKNVV